jgi:hypothetical protein
MDPGVGCLARYFLERLVKALDLAARLGVVRGGVLRRDAQSRQLGLEQDLALA